MSNGSDGKLTLSDWITYLVSEKSLNRSNVLSITAVVLALIALIFTVVNSSRHSDLVSAIVGGILLIILVAGVMRFYSKIVSPLQSRAEEAGRLLESIMAGKSKDPSEIEKQWQNFSKKEKKQATKKKAHQKVGNKN